jgi:hypothetical protein
MTPSEETARATYRPAADSVRDPLAACDAVLVARTRPMSERLELALSWNALAAELRVGLSAVRRTDLSQ